MARAIIASERRAAREPLYIRDPHSDATIEVFYADPVLARPFATRGGWCWWRCLPGCLPDTPPHGPFATSYGAFRDAVARHSKPRQFGRRNHAMFDQTLTMQADRAYEAALNNPSADWRAVAELMRAALASRRKRASRPLATEGWSPIADYPVTRYRTDRVGPTCVVTFADNEVTRMSTATLPNKPLNVGRGLRLSVAAYEARQRQRRTGGLVPPIVACHFERDGEVVARCDPAECNRHLGLT
jgi:hypothetical protein